jgi:hypothetical protein
VRQQTQGEPRRGRVVVAHGDRKAQRALARALGATRCTVDLVADVDAAIAGADADTVVVVDHALARERRGLPAAGRAWIAVPGDGAAPAEPDTTAALIEAGWRHVCAHPMPVLVEELLATVQKLRRADVFGLDKYMAWGAEARAFVLEDAGERDRAVAQLTRDVVGAGLPDRIGSLVSVIADELLANALYTAPVDAAGARFRRDEPRDRPRPRAGRAALALRWATDGRYLAIAVRDGWGSLDPAAVGGRLARASHHAAAGDRPIEPAPVGMGLALVYACCNQLVLDVAPGAATEVIALIDVRFRPTELARAASYHVFLAPPEAA